MSVVDEMESNEDRLLVHYVECLTVFHELREEKLILVEVPLLLKILNEDYVWVYV